MTVPENWLKLRWPKQQTQSKKEKLNTKTQRAPRRATSWSWEDGVVNVEGEHIELRYGDSATTDCEQWLPIALIGKPKSRVFPVRWLMTPDSPSHRRMIDAARKELGFYLIEVGGSYPWNYAIYHCNTAANMYSSVHWSYFPNGNRGQGYSSMIVTLADGTMLSKEIAERISKEAAAIRASSPLISKERAEEKARLMHLPIVKISPMPGHKSKG